MRKAKGKTGGLPSGYVNTSGQYAQAWNPEPGAILTGIVHSVRQEDARRLKRANAKKGEKVGIAEIIASETGEIVSVFESAGLKSFFGAIKPGAEIFLRFVETKKLGKKRFKVFESGVKKGK